MATLETIRHVLHRDEIVNGRVEWVAAKGRKVLEGLPQIVWTDQNPWREANLWALEQATTNKKNIKTIVSAMTGLHAYAKWLEKEDVSWWEFPAREADRCLVRYRGALIEARDGGELAPSTAKQRMATVIRFYRWLWARRLISPEWPMWKERQAGIRITDTFGFERTLLMTSTDLAIPNRRRIGDGLEDGLLPVSVTSRNSILSFANRHASQELALLLRLGFRTGMRLGTLTDLKVGTLDRAVPDPSFPTWFRIAIGPGAHPAVHTKFGVTGQVWIETGDLQLLKDYVFSARRLKRQALATPKHRDNVFLTRFGGRYGTEGVEMSRALNVEMGRLRKAGLAAGHNAFRAFHFHQSRCTFATELARMAIKHGGVSVAIQLVKQALCRLANQTRSWSSA